ncbi:DUF3606 domain-containing protein [Achromobacter insolitus]|uniref:DUF3606 domain-containing protein n=1 Tax=Achromobacter insolitus TaxID=217204 RepID=UPI00174AAE57|nr:DUF3606 domain-containing protein [Achromobacter insolitus]
MSEQIQPQDPARFNVNDVRELRIWAKEFDASEEQLRSAVKAVGPSAIAVRAARRSSLGRK